MNNKIKNYIDVLFADVPRSKKAAEMKEELAGSMNERFEDYIAQGMSETQAYSQTVANMGDVDALIAEVMPDAEFKSQAQFYRNRKGRNIGVAVGLYILGVAVLIAAGIIGTELLDSEIFVVFGVVGMLVLAAVATGMIIYTSVSTPREYKDYDEMEREDMELYSTPEGKKLRAVMSIYWSVITLVYLAVSFITFAWHVTWVIWPLAGVAESIIKTAYRLKEEK